MHFITVKIRLLGVLKYLVSKNRDEIILKVRKCSTIRDVIEQIYFESPELYRRIWNRDKHDLMPDIVIFLNDVDIRLLKYLDTEICEDSTIVILAYIHGG